MTDDNNTVDIEDVALEDFEAEFYGKKTEPVKAVEEPKEDDVDETEDDSLAPDEDEDESVEETEDDEADDSEEEEEEEVPPVKQQKKRNRAQERIEQLVAEAREAERRAEALERRLAELEAAKEVKAEEKAPTLREQLPAEAPQPDAVDDKGEPLYELGEFDPKYIRDLTRFTIEQETKAAKEAAEREAQERAIKQAQEEVTNKYAERVAKFEEEAPDFREKVLELDNTFKNIDPAYGEYLAMTIMSSEVGPELMYYFSQNIGEAQKIVASGPAAATLALGRLEAKFLSSTPQEEKRNTKQVSKAPEPPENIERARGRGGRFAVAPDTDDLNAFEREFFR